MDSSRAPENHSWHTLQLVTVQTAISNLKANLHVTANV